MTYKIYFGDEAREVDAQDAVFKTHERIAAAGGVIVDETGRVLMIFRRGKWDLPKGKAEENESMETCAEREVIEETGVKNISLTGHLITTYHTYVERGNAILKETYWYSFSASGNQELKPQLEEDITEIRWATRGDLDILLRNSYRMIADVLREGGFY